MWQKDAPPPAAPAAAPAAATTAAAPAATGETGVPECDAYIKKMESCFGNLTGGAKTAMEQNLKTSRDAFKQSAATPEGKAGLVMVCKQSSEAMVSSGMCK